jgi:FAD/FMN-containing dehydrogenase
MYVRTFVACYAMWDDAVGDAANLAWLPATMAELEQTTLGHYIAEADLLANHTRAPRSFTPANWQRLQEIRQAVDPAGIFATPLAPLASSIHNHNQK